MLNTEGRNPGVTGVARWFDSDHLPEDLKVVARACEGVAASMLLHLPDSPELTVGLRKLLEAKDAFVRCAVAARAS